MFFLPPRTPPPPSPQPTPTLSGPFFWGVTRRRECVFFQLSRPHGSIRFLLEAMSDVDESGNSYFGSALVSGDTLERGSLRQVGEWKKAPFGCGSKINSQGDAGFSLLFHLPRCNFGTSF